jgi:predicted RND superfamily exporter protein
MKLVITNFSLRHPWFVSVFVLIATLLFAFQFPKVHFDNDPENMLAENEYVRVFHHQIKEKFSLYDFVIVALSTRTIRTAFLMWRPWGGYTT